MLESTKVSCGIILILRGEYDPVLPPESGDGIHRFLTEMTYVLIKDSGHFVQEEAADRCVEEMRKFLKHYWDMASADK